MSHRYRLLKPEAMKPWLSLILFTGFALCSSEALSCVEIDPTLDVCPGDSSSCCAGGQAGLGLTGFGRAFRTTLSRRKVDLDRAEFWNRQKNLGNTASLPDITQVPGVDLAIEAVVEAVCELNNCNPDTRTQPFDTTLAFRNRFNPIFNKNPALLDNLNNAIVAAESGEGCAECPAFSFVFQTSSGLVVSRALNECKNNKKGGVCLHDCLDGVDRYNAVCQCSGQWTIPSDVVSMCTDNCPNPRRSCSVGGVYTDSNGLVVARPRDDCPSTLAPGGSCFARCTHDGQQIVQFCECDGSVVSRPNICTSCSNPSVRCARNPVWSDSSQRRRTSTSNTCNSRAPGALCTIRCATTSNTFKATCGCDGRWRGAATSTCPATVQVTTTSYAASISPYSTLLLIPAVVANKMIN